MYSFIGAIIYKFRVIRTLLFTTLFFCLNPASLANDFIDDISVVEEDGVYYINATSQILASEQQVRNVITDYDHIYRLSDSIIESKVVKSSDSDKVQVETLVLACVPLFCKEVTRVEEVNEVGSGLIKTRIISEKSDFISGKAAWKIERMGQVTRLTYQASLEPDFFIPPLLGTQMVINNMRDEFNTTFSRIQHIARINEDREWNDSFEFVLDKVDQEAEPCNVNYIANSL